jgi:hypothetical protein
MANPRLETFHGPLPLCRCCRKPLRAQYRTEQEQILEGEQPTGQKRVYLTEADQRYFGIPEHLDDVQEVKDRIGRTIYWSPLKLQWWKWEPVYRAKWRHFTGHFGPGGNDFFCSANCAFRWAVDFLRTQREEPSR